MHDTLANRGRVNYSSYNNEDLMKIKQVTQQFLNGEIEDIEQLDSLNMIREIFNQIKIQYNQTSQQIDSIKRQMAENPEKFKSHQAELEKQNAAKEEAKK